MDYQQLIYETYPLEGDLYQHTTIVDDKDGGYKFTATANGVALIDREGYNTLIPWGRIYEFSLKHD